MKFARKTYLYPNCNLYKLAAIGYYIALPFIYLISLLPFRALYFLSDVCFLFLYYVAGYRKKVVLQNLRNSFPEKSEKEINRIAKKFYSYFCDLFLETFKTLTISKNVMLEHCSFEPGSKQIIDKLAAENSNFIIAMGHKGNWEWSGNTFSILCRHQLYVIYHPLSNKHFNGLMYRMRTRFGTKLIAMKDTFRDMMNNRSELNATAFIADQTPHPDKAYWIRFLNQDTPVFPGIDKIARKINYPVVYISAQKIKRGYYQLYAETLATPPFLPAEAEIARLYTQRLEKDIITQPETWLWTHRRWKHKRIE